jgi:hypothetical protein
VQVQAQAALRQPSWPTRPSAAQLPRVSVLPQLAALSIHLVIPAVLFVQSN